MSEKCDICGEYTDLRQSIYDVDGHHLVCQDCAADFADYNGPTSKDRLKGKGKRRDYMLEGTSDA